MTPVLWFFNLFLFFAAYGSFIWGIRCHFRKEEKLPVSMRRLSLTFSVLGSIHLGFFMFSPAADLPFLIAGICLWLLSTGIFWWAVKVNQKTPLPIAFSNLPSAFIQKSGPYQIVRHPFYLSYSLAWIAGPIAANLPALLVTSLIMIGIYYSMARGEEKNLLERPDGAQYLEYKKKTGMFFPKL